MGIVKKGIILAGGAGSRLYPLTQVASKQLMPVYDKPMIYYPLSTLMNGGLREILIISTPQDTPRFEQLLGNGSRFGISIQYAVQPEPKGIAQAFLIGADFIGDDGVTLILGDNIFFGQMRLLEVFEKFTGGARVFAYHVTDPERYGVVEFDADQRVISIEEKPAAPKSNYAISGLYIYDNRVVEVSRNLKPSGRGELEITDVNKEFLAMGELAVELMGRGIAWLDTGTHASLEEASNFMSVVEKRQGLKVGCPEEVALRRGFLKIDAFEKIVDSMPRCEYSAYLRHVATEYREHRW